MARTTGLLVRNLADETVVYDLERHEAHCLNRTAALVFRHADGRRSVAGIALAVAADGPGADEAFVRLAVEKLAEAKLLENADAEPSLQTASPGRRDALRRVALGTALLAPVVVSLLVPTPAEAAATCIPAASCTAAKYGQPCYVTAQSECATKICISDPPNGCQ